MQRVVKSIVADRCASASAQACRGDEIHEQPHPWRRRTARQERGEEIAMLSHR